MKSVCQAPPVFVVLALVASMTPRAEAADPPKPSQPAAAPAAPAKMSAADEAKAREAAAKKAKEVELAVAKTIAASGPAIDACTQSYTAEFPTEDGRAQIQTTVAKNGMVTKANVTTPASERAESDPLPDGGRQELEVPAARAEHRVGVASDRGRGEEGPEVRAEDAW